MSRFESILLLPHSRESLLGDGADGLVSDVDGAAVRLEEKIERERKSQIRTF